MDKEIKCAEMGCDEVRVFTAGEQEFFQKKGFKEPKYCISHSKARKQARAIQENSAFKPALDTIRKSSRSHDEPSLGDDLAGI